MDSNIKRAITETVPNLLSDIKDKLEHDSECNCFLCGDGKMKLVVISKDKEGAMYINGNYNPQDSSSDKTNGFDNDGFIYICDNCPNISFEFLTNSSLEFLIWYLESQKK